MSVPSGRDKVLVIGDDLRAFLAVVRSLGRKGLEVHICAFDATSAALRSRYVAAVHRLPPYNYRPEAWVAAMRRLCETHRYRLVVPCDDRSILPLHRHAAEFAGVALALPNEAAYETFFDKWLTRETARQAGVPVAEGELLAPDTDIAALGRRYGYRLAVKPRRSFELTQVESRQSVRIVRRAADMAEAFAGIHDPADYFVEAFFTGEGVGVSILARAGEVLQAFEHHRAFASSPTGGSTYRVSAALDPNLADYVERMARATGLDGVAMFEFRQDLATGEAILLEVNARFWGSLPLAIASGVDFPALLYEMLVEGRAAPRIDYRVGHFARAMFPDFYRLLGDMRDADLPLWRRLWLPVRDAATALWRLATGRESIDTFDRRDLRPFWLELGMIGERVGGVFGRLVPFRAPTRRRVARRRLQTALAGRPAAGKHLVAVLCYGNICRSPLAAELLRRKLDGERNDVEIVSAGFIAREDRRSPENAVAAAGELGIDLSAHRSRYADDEMLRDACALIVFDDKNVDELRKRGVAALDRVVPLNSFGDDPAPIEDPFGADLATFRACYRRIDRSLEALVRTLKR